MKRRGSSGPPRPRERGWRPPRHGGDVRVALAYPGAYRAGMSLLGFQTVLYRFAALPGVLAERVFLEDDGARLSVLDAGFAPGEADLVAFSISGENDYENLLRMLRLARLPLRAADRASGSPLVVAGASGNNYITQNIVRCAGSPAPEKYGIWVRNDTENIWIVNNTVVGCESAGIGYGKEFRLSRRERTFITTSFRNRLAIVGAMRATYP